MYNVKCYKPTLRYYLQNAYTDERLAMLLAHAQSGRLAWYSCCCFVGVATADHALQGECEPLSLLFPSPPTHLYKIGFNGVFASNAYQDIADNDCDRRRLVIPLIKAEMKRREWAKKKDVDSEMAQLVA